MRDISLMIHDLGTTGLQWLKIEQSRRVNLDGETRTLYLLERDLRGITNWMAAGLDLRHYRVSAWAIATEQELRDFFIDSEWKAYRIVFGEWDEEGQGWWSHEG